MIKPFAHSLSVIVPVITKRFGGAANVASRTPILKGQLFTGNQEMGCRCSGVHDPHTTLLAVFRQAERLAGGIRDGDCNV